MNWTDEKVEQLTILWAAGDSASITAAKLGISRNAVIGKVRRLDLPDRETIACKPHPRPSTRPKSRQPRPEVKAARDWAKKARWNENVKQETRVKARKFDFANYEEPTKNQLRAMLTQAVINTAAM